jgi:hypothetical protein
MTKVVSFRDILLAEELAHIKNEIELLDIKNDDIVKKVLKQLAFDCEYGVAYIPTKHRDMRGKIAIGFQCVGEVTLNRDLLNSSVCDATDRLVATSHRDVGFAKELASMMGAQVDLSRDDDAEYVPEEDFDESQVEDDYEFVLKQIKQLEEVRDMVRGSMYNAAGDVKTYEEYKKK